MEEPMKKLTRHWLIAILVLGFFAGAGCRREGESADVHGEEGGREPGVVVLPPAALASGNIRTAVATLREFRRRIAATGELTFNARRLARVSARAVGRVERVLAVSGDRVGAGQVLAELYSPEFLALQAEYLQAAERAKRRRNGDDDGEARAARALLEGARSRLLLAGATEADADALAASGTPRPLLAVRAPFAATVIAAAALAGDHVDLGSELFRVADLAVLWADVHVQEKDLAAVQAGAAVELRVQAYPGEVFSGRLLLVGDMLDEGTRALPARVEVANPGGRLKAGMYVDALIAAGGLRTALAVPESAVQDDHGRPVVFVETGRGEYRRREVATGERSAGWLEILRGLAAGETVVAAGSFLLESEMHKDSLEDEHGHS
jgi:RND family efflux transporter MFP subunit